MQTPWRRFEVAPRLGVVLLVLTIALWSLSPERQGDARAAGCGAAFRAPEVRRIICAPSVRAWLRRPIDEVMPWIAR